GVAGSAGTRIVPWRVPERASGLAATRRRRGEAGSAPAATTATASRTCSQLSSTSRHGWERSHCASAAASTPTELATIPETISGSAAAERSQKRVSAWSRLSRSASSTASRVLPEPPAPVSVRRRLLAARAPASASSDSRPTKLVSWTGRPLTSPSRRSPLGDAPRPRIETLVRARVHQLAYAIHGVPHVDEARVSRRRPQPHDIRGPEVRNHPALFDQRLADAVRLGVSQGYVGTAARGVPR